jgi:HK97 family phage portal protein
MGEYGPAYYIYEYGGKRTEYHPSEIIHIKNLLPGSEPKDDFVGKSIVGRALDIIKADNELNGYLKRYFANDTIPPYILKSQDELEETQIQHFLTKWNNKLPGHKMMGVLTGGMEAVALSNNSGFSGSISDVNKLLMEKISIIFGIPFQKLTGAATSVASAEVSDFSFRMDTIEPLAFEIVSAINILLANHDPYLVIDFEEFNYESKADSIKQEENDIKYGVLTINEVRSKRGLEPVEWGNAPYGQEATPDKIVD